MKEGDPGVHSTVAIAKYVPPQFRTCPSLILFSACRKKDEIARARARARRKQNQLKDEALAISALIRNQEQTIANRLKFMAHEAAKIEKIRADVVKRQKALHGAAIKSDASVEPSSSKVEPTSVSLNRKSCVSPPHLP